MQLLCLMRTMNLRNLTYDKSLLQTKKKSPQLFIRKEVYEQMRSKTLKFTD